jgi:hypothetical protein
MGINMKQLKGIVFVLAGLFIMITLVSLLIPSKVMTARSVVVHGNAGYIFSEISNLKRWKDWHPVFKSDSNTIKTSDPSSGVGASATWSTNGKENKLVITENQPDLVKVSLMRKGENDVESIISINHVADSSAVQVEWRVLTRLKWYPWEKFYGIFVDKITGPGYELALNNLKELAESKDQ